MLKFENISDVERFIQKNEVKQIDIKFTNLFGGLHHITIPSSTLKKAVSEGIGVDGSSIPGFAKAEKSDVALFPDLETGFIDPFFDVKTLSFFGSIYLPDGAPHPFDSRYIAMKAENFLKEKPYADKSMWGPEFEFYVFDRVRCKNAENIAYYEIESEEAGFYTQDNPFDWNYEIRKAKGYHAIPPKDRLYNFRSELSMIFENAGISVRYHHHENGSAGQMEIEVQLKGLLESGDQGQLAKYFIKMLAFENGFIATFMPKPLYNEAGSGMHFHQVLLKDGLNAFFENESKGFELTETALSYIAGLLIHSPSLLAITNPSTNSYKRLFSGFEAPNRAFFSFSNRKASIRIPVYVKDPLEKRIEFRPPDATGNVYLSMSAMLLAGIDGIENSLNLKAKNLDSEESAIMLPKNLEEALTNLSSDNEYLTKNGIFDRRFVNLWIESKLKDANEVNARPHPYEVELYLDC